VSFGLEANKLFLVGGGGGREVGGGGFDYLATLFVYSTSVFTASVGLTLTALFLGLCWCDAAWQRDVRRANEARGYPGFGTIMLVQHIPSAFVALADMYLGLKDPALLSELTPSLPSLCGLALAYCALYVAFLHLNCSLNGGAFPYPFLTGLRGWAQWAAFTAAVTVFISSIMAVLTWTAL
jgi:hypothetical protein